MPHLKSSHVVRRVKSLDLNNFLSTKTLVSSSPVHKAISAYGSRLTRSELLRLMKKSREDECRSLDPLGLNAADVEVEDLHSLNALQQHAEQTPDCSTTWST